MRQTSKRKNLLSKVILRNVSLNEKDLKITGDGYTQIQLP
jgi:hypothetical protein